MPVARVRVHGDGPDAEATRRSVTARPAADVAVTDTPLAEAFDPAFVQVDVPAGVAWSSGTVERIVTLFGDHQVGVIRAVVDDLDGAVVTVARSRAVRRARLVRPDADPVGVAGDLFGVWWVDAGALGLRPLVLGAVTLAATGARHKQPKRGHTGEGTQAQSGAISGP